MNDYGELLHNATAPLLIRVIYPSWGSSSNLKGLFPHLQSYSVLFDTNEMNSSELYTTGQMQADCSLKL